MSSINKSVEVTKSIITDPADFFQKKILLKIYYRRFLKQIEGNFEK